MKMHVEQIESQKTYVARILGLHRKFHYERKFLEAESRRPIKLATSLFGCRHQLTYDLTDGLYEIVEHDVRTYLAVVKNRRISLETSDLNVVRRLCTRSNRSLLQLFDKWARSKRKSSKSFVDLAKKETAEQLAKIRDFRKAQSKQRSERVLKMTAREAFNGNNGAETARFVKLLEKTGNEGRVAAELFRCQKSSTRAKTYRRKYRDSAYKRKQNSIHALCEVLSAVSNLIWGWKEDPNESYAKWVLYVVLPQGQVSFHSPSRDTGPDYSGEWDGKHESERRILAFCDGVLRPSSQASEPLDTHVTPAGCQAINPNDCKSTFSQSTVE